MLPDEPLVELKPNRVAANENGTFLDGKGRSAGVTLQDTAGCSAAQIIAVAGLGNGHSKFGISKGELMEWGGGGGGQPVVAGPPVRRTDTAPVEPSKRTASAASSDAVLSFTGGCTVWTWTGRSEISHGLTS